MVEGVTKSMDPFEVGFIIDRYNSRGGERIPLKVSRMELDKVL